MKIRTGFVSNSSSTSFLITNHSNTRRTLVEFINENPQFIKEYIEDYGHYGKPSQLKLLYSAKERDVEFASGETKQCIFGDEQGTLIGNVLDYMLRGGGRSKNFSWEVDEYLR